MTKILVLAGEASGDLHGGHVLRELRRFRPELEIIGTGGQMIANLGATLYYSVEDLAVIGFFEVARRYSYYKNIFDSIVQKLDDEKPDAVFLVDYAGFNLKLAKEAKKRGIRVIFYVAPQVWAWKKKRIEILKAYVDELIVLFPFEVSFFRQEGMETHCFGHPLLDIVKASRSREAFLEAWSLDGDKPILALLPGSRTNEITKHLPLLSQTAQHLKRLVPEIQYIMPLAPTVRDDVIKERIKDSSLSIRTIPGDTYTAVAHSDFALVASGTATLETAILGTPEIIYYKSSLITYLIGKYLLRIKMIGLPNIIARDLVIPEDPHFTSPEKMAKRVAYYLNHPAEYDGLQSTLQTIRSKLGNTGAYLKTAEFLHAIL